METRVLALTAPTRASWDEELLALELQELSDDLRPVIINFGHTAGPAKELA